MKSAEHIKTAIIKRLIEGALGFNKKTNSVGVEVQFSRNKRRADLLITGREFHALEIKGDADNLRKLRTQLSDYQKVFDRVSVVVTEKHLTTARMITPKDVGIILFKNDQLHIIRQATLRKRLDKKELLMFLSKSEITELFQLTGTKEYSTDELREAAAEMFTIKEVRKLTYSKIQVQYDKLFKMLLTDTNGNIIEDELKGLVGNIGKIRL